MKKSVFIVAALMAGPVVFGQQKEKQPPPPPPAPPKVVNVKEVPPPPPPPPRVQKAELPSDYQAFLKRNPTVKGIRWSSPKTVRITLKSGREEAYHLDNEQEVKALHDKYGELPKAPPPPPPPRLLPPKQQQ